MVKKKKRQLKKTLVIVALVSWITESTRKSGRTVHVGTLKDTTSPKTGHHACQQVINLSFIKLFFLNVSFVFKIILLYELVFNTVYI